MLSDFEQWTPEEFKKEYQLLLFKLSTGKLFWRRSYPPGRIIFLSIIFKIISLCCYAYLHWLQNSIRLEIITFQCFSMTDGKVHHKIGLFSSRYQNGCHNWLCKVEFYILATDIKSIFSRAPATTGVDKIPSRIIVVFTGAAYTSWRIKHCSISSKKSLRVHRTYWRKKLMQIKN